MSFILVATHRIILNKRIGAIETNSIRPKSLAVNIVASLTARPNIVVGD